MHFHKSEAFYDQLLLDDCPALDLSTELLGIGSRPGELTCRPREDCVLCGVEEAAHIWRRLGLHVVCEARNGDRRKADEIFLRVTGPAAQLHKAWKITQVLMEYMSGIATRTDAMLAKAREANPAVHVSVTRKNFPGGKLQCLEATVSGGAIIHRLNLSDSILFFEQHRLFLGEEAECSAELSAELSADEAMERFLARVPALKRHMPERKLCAEADRPEHALALARAGLDMIQCEKFAVPVLEKTVREIRRIRPDLIILAAGGIHGDNAAAYAATGVDVLVTSWVYFGKAKDIKITIRPASMA